jgi:proteasome lid subunit RPN8/RPN11
MPLLFRRGKKKVQDPKQITCIPANVVARTIELLRQSGTRTDPHEGIVYWAGRRHGAESVVTTCIAPAAATTRGSFDTSAETNARVIMALAKAGLELLGQVHSHPGLFVDHSHGDDENALMPYKGFFSIVVPAYARKGMLPLGICGVHVFEGAYFRRLSQPELDSRFRVVDDIIDLRR